MKKLMTKLTSAALAFLLSGAMLLQAAMPVTVSANTNLSGLDDDTEIKDYIAGIGQATANRYSEVGERIRISGWDFNEIGGTVDYASKAFSLKDTNAELPVEALREFESATYGELEWHFCINPGTGLRDASVMLREGDTPAVAVRLDEQYVWLDTAQGRQNMLPYKTGVVYHFYVVVHLDSGTYDLYIDEQLYAEGILLGAKTVDNFFMTTGKQSSGVLTLTALVLTRGRWIREYFNYGNGTVLSPGWTLRTTNPATGVTNDAPASFGSGTGILIDTTAGNTWLEKNFGTHTRDFKLRYAMRAYKDCEDAQILLTSEGKPLLKLYMDGKDICYQSGSDMPVKTYENYKDDLWYWVEARVRFSDHTFDLYIADKLMAENVPLPADAASVDAFKAGGNKSGAGFYVHRIEITPLEQVDDYVPRPQPADSENLDVGMQYFGLWQEGSQFGWDPINTSDFRRPLDGFYDEYSAEHWDWQIKYWVEHGIDFVAPCWYASNPTYDSENPWLESDGYTGYFRAKYSDMMKFALLMEISGWPSSSNPQADADKWLRNTWRQVIEYYFKDPRYYTNGGRPVMFLFGYPGFNKAFGSYQAEVIKRMGDMCEAEGVSRPIILLNPQGVSDGGLSSYLDTAAAIGADGAWHYHSTTGGWPQDAIGTNLRHYEIAKEKNMIYVPTLDAGYDGYAWTATDKVNYAMNDEQWRYELQQFKEKYLPLPTNAATPMAMIATWNEWGEGHFFGPCEGYGYSRLDGLREYLTNAGPHTDVGPTEHQKDRFNNSYPWWRTTPFLREVNVGETSAPNAYEKYLWNFDDSENMGWAKVNSARPDTVEDGVWKLTAGTDIGIKLTDSGVDTANVTHVRLRMKNRGGGYAVTTDFSTPFCNTASFGRTIHNGMLNQYSDEFTDYYIPVGKYPEFWKGILNSMQIVISGYTEGETLELDSVAFMALPQKEETTLNIDGWSTGTPAIMRDGMPLLPLRSVTDKMTAEIYYDPETEKVWIDNGGVFTSFVPGEDTVESGGEIYTLPGSSFMEDGTTYADARLLSVAFRKSAAWDTADKILTLTDNTQQFVPSRPNSERKLLWSEEFNNLASLNYNGGVSGAALANGVYGVTTSNEDPQVVLNVPSVDLSEAKLISVGLRTDTAFRLQVFFTTNASTNINESKSFFVQTASSSDCVEYTIDPTKNAYFNGSMLKLRIDLGDKAGVNVGLDYIRIYGDYDHEMTDDEIADRYGSHTAEGEDIVWNFDLNTRKDGWLLSKSLANADLRGGVLTADIICANPFIETAQSNLDIEAASHGTVKICMSAPAGATRAKLYFTTDKDGEWTESKCVEIPLLSGGTANISYTADMSANANWKGKIKALRLMVPNVREGAFSVDFINVVGNRANTEK